MGTRNLRKRLERVEASLAPRERDVLKIIVTNPWGVIGEINLEIPRSNGWRDRDGLRDRAVLNAGRPASDRGR